MAGEPPRPSWDRQVALSKETLLTMAVAPGEMAISGWHDGDAILSLLAAAHEMSWHIVTVVQKPFPDNVVGYSLVAIVPQPVKAVLYDYEDDTVAFGVGE